jgi:hypothetical protein
MNNSQDSLYFTSPGEVPCLIGQSTDLVGVNFFNSYELCL